MVNANPVLDAAIAKASQDPMHLFIFANIFHIEIPSAGVLVHTHDGKRDISGQEHWYFGWGILFNGCKL